MAIVVFFHAFFASTGWINSFVRAYHTKTSLANDEEVAHSTHTTSTYDEWTTKQNEMNEKYKSAWIMFCIGCVDFVDLYYIWLCVCDDSCEYENASTTNLRIYLYINIVSCCHRPLTRQHSETPGFAFRLLFGLHNRNCVVVIVVIIFSITFCCILHYISPLLALN